MMTCRVDNDKLKEYLMRIVTHPNYEAYINLFLINNQNCGDDIEESIWRALSKGM